VGRKRKRKEEAKIEGQAKNGGGKKIHKRVVVI